MRFLNPSITRSIVVAWLLLAPAALLAQAGPAPERPTGLVTLEVVRSQLEGIEASTDFDEATRATLTELYRKTISHLETADSYQESAARFGETVETAPDEANAARESLERKKEQDVGAVPSFAGMSLDELDQRLQKEKANLAAVEAKLAEFEAQLKKENDRPIAIRARLTEAKSRKAEAESDLATPAQPAALPQLTQAKKWLLESELEMLRTEILMLDQELLSQPARVELLKAERDLAEHAVESLRATVAELEHVANEARLVQAEEAKAEAQAARREAEGKHPLVQQLAERNASLSEALNALATELDGINEQEVQATQEAGRIEKSFNNAQQRIEIAGLSQVLGQVLLEERRSLPSTRAFYQQAKARERKIGATSLAQLQLEDERRELRDVEKYVADLSAELPAAEAATIGTELEQLTKQRLELIEKATSIQDAYLRAMGELDFAQRRLFDVVERYDKFLGKHLLWVRTSPRVGPESIRAIPGQTAQLLSPHGWSEVLETLVQRSTETPYLGLSVLAFVLLQWNRRRLHRALRATGDNVGRITSDRLDDTFRAFVIILLLALPGPLLAYVVGWELLSADDAPAFAKVIGQALSGIAPVFFSLQALRLFLRPNSVAAVHFGWVTSGLQALSRDLKWFIPGVVAGGFVTIAAIEGDADHLGTGLGRLAFVVVMGLFTVLFFRLTRPKRGTLWLFFAQGEHPTILRLRYLWFALLVLPPVYSAVVALLGFLYSGGTLIDLILKSIYLLLILIIVHQTIYRWLLLSRQRLALHTAHARLAAMREARKASEEADEGSAGLALELEDIEERDIDLTALDHDSRKLMDNAFLIAAVIGLWVIWEETLPAFAFFGEITLWTYTSTIGETAKQVPITLADLMYAILIVAITLLAIRRFPALLEIAMLQRLKMTPASRYTATTLVKYTIAATGTAMAFSALGGSWSEIQWIFAALGVGIGFGLQEIVANFISGLVILFERPIRVGDVVTVGDTDGIVTRIRIRATTIRNWDRKELLVPNKEFITQRLLNWSLSDQVTRIVIPVGVDYGSDVQRALLLLEETAAEHPRVLEDPAPLVVFEGFGDNSLNLSLRCYIDSIDYRLATVTDLNLAINQRFIDAGIGISFPQRDVHLDTKKPLDVRIHRAPSED